MATWLKQNEVIYSLVSFQDRLFTGSYKRIKVWNSENQLIVTLRGHVGYVFSMRVHCNLLFSGSCDTSIHIWDLTTQIPISLAILEGHSNCIYSMAAYETRLFSFANEMIAWDFETQDPLITYDMTLGHSEIVRCMAVSKQLLFLGCEDETIQVWDCETMEFVEILHGHTGIVTELLAVGEDVLFSASYAKIKCWDLSVMACAFTISGHDNFISSLAIHEMKLISASWDATVLVWDLLSVTQESPTPKCIAKFVGHTERIYTLSVWEGRLYSGSFDGTVLVWNLADL